MATTPEAQLKADTLKAIFESAKTLAEQSAKMQFAEGSMQAALAVKHLSKAAVNLEKVPLIALVS